mmetsp:Transcript_5020/g.20657  ORF Transcript_5020/g.20657 Transcript_5020/m.20657 type:complete len:256 (-) Transcript_5020:36-803(-)
MNRALRMASPVTCAFCHSIQRSIPGRCHPHSRTRLVAQSHSGLFISASRSLANASGGRRSSDSISPTRSAFAAAYAALRAFPCPLGPCALTLRTTSELPRAAVAATCSTVSGVCASDSHPSIEAGKGSSAPSPSAEDPGGGAAVAVAVAVALVSAGSPTASSTRAASAAARASSHSLDPSVDESSTAMSSKPPCSSRPTCARTLPTQSGSQGIAFLQGMSTETHGAVDDAGASSPPTRVRFALGGSSSRGFASRS